MPDAPDTPLLDMVVKRISQEVASVLKVDAIHIEEHLGALESSPAPILGAIALTLPCDRDVPGRRSVEVRQRQQCGADACGHFRR